MNASDIIKKKQNTCLYRAYYNPIVYQSTVFSTFMPYSSISSGTTTYTSNVNTINQYICPPHIMSYNIINDILYGKISSDDKLTTDLQWKNTVSTVQYYYSTNIVTSSYILTGPEPNICSNIAFNTLECSGSGGRGVGGENAGVVVAAKRDGALYNAYYIPFSSISSQSTSYLSTSDNIYTHVSNPLFMTYQLSNKVSNGAYICGKKQISELDWKNTTSSIQLYFSTSGFGDISTITSSFVMRGPEPIICPLVQFYQGVETTSYNDCDLDQYCCEDTIMYYNLIYSGY